MSASRPIFAVLRVLPALFAVSFVACLHVVCAAQEPPKPEGAKNVKPYDEIITKDAVSDPGLFLVHRLDEKLFYEIRPDVLGKDMLWVTQLEETQAGFSYAGMPVQDRVVRWELRNEIVLLRSVNYTIRADVKDPIKYAVEATSLAPIIRTFPVKAWGKDKSPVIEVAGLFTSDVPEFSARRLLGASGFDAQRSFIEQAKSFPENIETKVIATYTLQAEGPSARGDAGQSGVTVLLHHSMVKLPDVPMKPRRSDGRVGYFSVDFDDFGANVQHQVEKVEYITRWCLEKKDPAAPVSEPRQPIVFYVGREVPEKWKTYVKKGIEMWQPAFEAAGFKSAILGKYAPDPREDPDWDAEDARISTIRWLPSTIENAFGPHVHDPRTGQILEADVRLFHNVLKLVRDWYFVQASPNDPRAQKLPLPDDLMGELLAYVVAHEVGHSLGFRHNMKASAAYTIDELRNAEFTKKNGTTASIMDYARFNYVAQPGDGAALVPMIGPYDFFAVEWGYREFKPGEDEKAKLEEIVRRQVSEPLLRFGDPNPLEDPSQQTEDLGADPVAATDLGLRNIQRIASYLVGATCQRGEDYSLLKNMYDKLLGQWSREIAHVINVVGGVERLDFYYGDADQVYHPVEGARQRAAVRFLNERAFRTPKEFVDPGIVLRLEASGSVDRVLAQQEGFLRLLLSEARLKRMGENAARLKDPYTPAELLADVRSEIWGDAVAAPVGADVYSRNLQRAHVEYLAASVEVRRIGSDLPALARAELEAILRLAGERMAVADSVTQAHLMDVRARILKAVDPNRSPRDEAPVAAF